MPYGKPKHVKPWYRENWPSLNKGQKLFAISEWQCYLIRNGKINELRIDDDVCAEINIPNYWRSTKARNLIRIVTGRDEEIVDPAGQQPTADTSQESLPDLEDITFGPRHLRNDQPPDLTLQEPNVEDDDENQETTPQATVSDSDSEPFLGFEDEYHNVLQELGRKEKVCIHTCDKQYHIIVHNAPQT